MKNLKVIIKLEGLNFKDEESKDTETVDLRTIETEISFAQFPMYMNLYKDWASKLQLQNPGLICTPANFLNGVLRHFSVVESINKKDFGNANHGMERFDKDSKAIAIKTLELNDEEVSRILESKSCFYDSFDDIYLETKIIIGSKQYSDRIKELEESLNKSKTDSSNILSVDVAKKSVEKELRFNPETGMMQPVHTKPNGFIKKFFRKEK